MREVVGECFLCGATENLTDDHVPPDGLFSSPKPSDLITVPSCEARNNSYKLDDEYLRAFLASNPKRNPTGKIIWDKKVVGSTFQRSAKFREMLRRAIKPVDLHTPAGLYLGTLDTIGWDGKRLIREFEKTIKGLYMKESGSRLPSDIKFQFYDHSNLELIIKSGLIDFYIKSKERTIGAGDVFSYRFVLAQDDPFVGFWWLFFYKSTVVFCVHDHQNMIEEPIEE